MMPFPFFRKATPLQEEPSRVELTPEEYREIYEEERRNRVVEATRREIREQLRLEEEQAAGQEADLLNRRLRKQEFIKGFWLGLTLGSLAATGVSLLLKF